MKKLYEIIKKINSDNVRLIKDFDLPYSSDLLKHDVLLKVLIWHFKKIKFVKIVEYLERTFSFTNQKKYSDERVVFNCAFEYFDDEYYRMQYWWDRFKNKNERWDHFLKYGSADGRNPNYWFDTNFYKKTYLKDNDTVIPFLHYMEFGIKKGYFCNQNELGNPIFEKFSLEVIGLKPKILQHIMRKRYLDLKERIDTGEIGNQIKKGILLDPNIAHGLEDLRKFRRPFLETNENMQSMVAIKNIFEFINHKKFVAMVFVPWIRMGGSDKFTKITAESLAKEFGNENILILTTNEPPSFSRFISSNIKILDLSKYLNEISLKSGQRLVLELVRATQPDFCININSGFYWDLLEGYGDHLKTYSNQVAMMFCDDINHIDNIDGYPMRRFPTCYDFLDHIFTDSDYLIDQLKNRYMLGNLDKNKMHRLDAPVDDAIIGYKRSFIKQNGKVSIFWSGRFDRQKRFDIVLEIAKRLPEINFFVWGKSVLNDFTFDLNSVPDNVKMCGTYDKITQLNLNDCDFWLYTSEWDGVPNLLIEVAGLGIPLLGTNKCGGSQILNENTGYVVNDINNVNEYVDRINELLSDRSKSERKAYYSRQLVLNERTEDNFHKTLINSLINK